MAYVKLFKTVPDVAIGYQTLNQAVSNVVDIYEDYGLRHGTVDPPPNVGLGPFPWTVYGQHNDNNIPRTVARVVPSNVAGAIVPSFAWNQGGGLGEVSRFSTGIYVFEVRGLERFWAKVEAEQVGSEVLWPSWRYEWAGTASSVLYVYLRYLTGGSFEYADYNFNVTLFGEPFV